MNIQSCEIDDPIAVFKALADGTRLRIVGLLMDAGELCVCDIERVLDLPQALVSRHLNILRNASMVSARRQGRWMRYSLAHGDSVRSAVLRSLKSFAGDIPELAADRDALRSKHERLCSKRTNFKGK